jgi:hypothetical protein
MRKNGFYWAKYKGDWEICNFKNGYWYINGSLISSHNITEIGELIERKIPEINFKPNFYYVRGLFNYRIIREYPKGKFRLFAKIPFGRSKEWGKNFGDIYHIIQYLNSNNFID